MADDFDAVVIGGGPAGAVASLVLARAGRRVLLVDKGGCQEFRIGETLPPAANRLLRDLGLHPLLEAGGHIRCPGNVSAWGETAIQCTDFISDPDGCGWHVDRARFDAALRSSAQQAGAAVWEDATMMETRRSESGWLSRINRDHRENQTQSRWMLDCSGRSAWFARWQGAKFIDDDRLIASVALFEPIAKTADDRDATTLVESVAEGWWYTTRLPDGNRVAAHFTDADLPSARMAHSGSGYAELLDATVHVRSRLASYTMKGSPRVRRANSARLEPCAGDNWLAAGDAALAFDPLSSQGIFHSLYAGMNAGEAVNAAMAGNAEPVVQYRARLQEIYAAYLHNRDAFYACERRWNSVFWQRRHARVAAATDASEQPGRVAAVPI